MSAPAAHPVEPSSDECGIASWEPGDLAALLLPAWDEFAEIAGAVDLDAPSRVRGWTAREPVTCREGPASERNGDPFAREGRYDRSLVAQPKQTGLGAAGEKAVGDSPDAVEARLSPVIAQPFGESFAFRRPACEEGRGIAAEVRLAHRQA